LRRIIAFCLGAAVLIAISIAVWLLVSPPGENQGTGGSTTGGTAATPTPAAPATVTLSLDQDTPFEFKGEPHQARLLQVVGSSARIRISSSPIEVTLTAGQPAEVDLTDDSVADATVTLDEVSQSSVTMTVDPLAPRKWDESAFQTNGGLAPYDIDHYYESDPALVPETDGDLWLFYVAQDTRIHWERYRPDGQIIKDPELASGWLPAEIDTESIDAGMLPGGPAVAYASWGLWLIPFDNDMVQQQPRLFIGQSLNYPSIAVHEDKMWIAAQGQPETLALDETGGKSKVVITELGTGTPVSYLRQRSVTDPGEDRDLLPDIAYDDQTGKLAVVYQREAKGSTGAELRLAVVDPSTLTPERDISVAAKMPVGDVVQLCGVTAADRNAIVFWSTGGAADIHLATVDLAGGTVAPLWDGQSRNGAPDVTARFDVDLAILPSGPAMAYLDSMELGGEAFRFRVWPITESGWGDDPVTLEGGPPVLSDVMIDLNAFRQNPRKAICGSQSILEGAVFNRGSSIARNVRVDVSVDGSPAGSVSLDSVKAGQSVPFAIGWTPSPDLTAEEITVEYTVTTDSEEYTQDNNDASFTAVVRQNGVVFGRVVNSSSDVNQESGWYPGLEGVRITVGDTVVLTDASGSFTIDGLPFGSYTIQAELEGFNPLSTDFEVVRTRPMASVTMLMDNHGVLRMKVVDQAGAPLSGVDVYLIANRQLDKTDTSGEVAYDISAGTYHFSFIKRGYWSIADQPLDVLLGQDRTETVVMQEATTAFLSGQVVDKYGAGVAGASVTIKAPDGTVVAQFTADANGFFPEQELPAKPPKTYKIIASSGGLTVEQAEQLYGGDRRAAVVALIPDRGDLRLRSATEGYTSWMIKASWPGFMAVPSAAMYVWYGNYAISVATLYWSNTKELAGVDVTVWGGTYETHATQSEIDLTEMDKDYGELFETTGIESFGGLIKTLTTDHAGDLLDIAGSVKDLITGDAAEDAVTTGQGRELLTWKEALDDFNVNPEFDSSDPVGSMWNVVEAVPRSFAIPIVIGGSSVQDTSVRVDQVDVVRLATGEVLWSSGLSEWYSHQGPGEIENENGRHYAFNKPDVEYDNVVVYVWLTVQKLSGGSPGGTCFDQREQQVIVFHPGPRKMEGLIAPGDLYRNPQP
jgi:hypothetical protein